MRGKVFLLMFLLCFSTGCMGPKGASMGTSNMPPLTPGKSMYIAAINPIPEETSDLTEFIVEQFAKILSGVSRAITTGAAVDSDAEGIAASKAVGAEYLVLLQISAGETHSRLNPGQGASLTVTVIDTATEQICNRVMIETACYAMAVGPEQLPSECIRPQIAAWIEKTFDTAKPPTPQINYGTLALAKGIFDFTLEILYLIMVFAR
jgi:hypothetical protein